MASLTISPNDFKVNILVAYPYFDKNIFNELLSWDKSRYRLIVDSGAFTAWKAGNPIKLDDYCKFLDSIEKLRPFNAIQLDVIRNPSSTESNFKEMISRGYDVLPVFTRGSSLDWLRECFKTTDYVLFGGIVEGSGNQEYVQWFMQHLRGRKTHWLGFDKREYIIHYRPYSYDSSSWLSAARFGNLRVYSGRNRLESFNRKTLPLHIEKAKKCMDAIKVPKEWQYKFSEDEKAFWTDGDINKTKFAMKITAWSYILRNYDVEKKLGSLGYLALATVDKLKVIKLCQQKIIEAFAS